MDQEDEKHYRSPFYLACKNEDIELVKSMLDDSSIDVNWATDRTERTAFMCACYKPNPNIELIRVLMNTNRIDYNKREINGFTGFCMLFTDPDNEYRHRKITDHKMMIIKELMEDPRIDITIMSLSCACYNGSIELIEIFLNNNKIDPNACDVHGRTTFYRLCYDDTHIKTLKYLLNNPKIDVNLADKNGITPFISACSNKASKIIKLLASSDRIKINHQNAIISIFNDMNSFNVFKKLIKLYDTTTIEQILT